MFETRRKYFGAATTLPNTATTLPNTVNCSLKNIRAFCAVSRVSPFLGWGDFHARSRFARSTIPEEKWGTTRSLASSNIR